MNFFDSYYQAAKHLSDADRHAFYDQVFTFYYEGYEGEVTGAAAAVWEAVKPVLIKSLKKSGNGKKGGRPKADKKQTESKLKANKKQTESKTKANEKQTESHMDMDMEKDIDTTPLNPPTGEDEVDAVVEYMNQVCGTSYKASTKPTRKAIHARLSDGFTVNDFKTVIDKKARDWIGTEWEKYLRPSTLFAPSKFEAYLNQQGGNREVDWSEL